MVMQLCYMGFEAAVGGIGVEDECLSFDIFKGVPWRRILGDCFSVVLDAREQKGRPTGGGPPCQRGVVGRIRSFGLRRNPISEVQMAVQTQLVMNQKGLFKQIDNVQRGTSAMHPEDHSRSTRDGN